ncbi:hypothetical protein ScPMuIL_000350 [Solemya velum]
MPRNILEFLFSLALLVVAEYDCCEGPPSTSQQQVYRVPVHAISDNTENLWTVNDQKPTKELYSLPCPTHNISPKPETVTESSAETTQARNRLVDFPEQG